MDDSRTGNARPGPRGGGGGPAELGNALEALRVITTFVVVLYHAALTYVAVPLRLTIWMAYDASGHRAFDAFIYWVNGFAMPVFFLAAGISAPAACESRGARVFLEHRAGRLLRPLLFGCFTVVPMFYLLWGYGLMVTGRLPLDRILSWRFEGAYRQNLYGPAHLWFLEYLFIVCALWAGGWSLRKALGRDNATGAEWPQRLLASPWKPLLCALPTAVIFLVDSDTMLRVDNNIVPNVFRVLHYAVFFAVGAWIAKAREPRQCFLRYSGVYLALAFVLYALMLPLLLRHAAAPLEGWTRSAYCGMAALFPWLTTFGGLGVLLRVVRGRGAVMRFLSEASFWVYIAHVPVVAFVQIVLLPLAWPGALKFAVVAIVAIAASLASYEWVVRRSLIGAVVNGARKRSQRRGLLGPEFGWIATAALFVLLFAGATWQYRVFFFGHNCYEELSGQVYRSARLKPAGLERMIRERGLRTVVAFTGGGGQHPWVTVHRAVCQSRGVALYALPLRADRPPSREELARLVGLLEQSPRPLLVEGYRGIDQNGLAAAVALLLAGAPPEAALREFSARYGQFGGAEHSALGQVILAYRRALAARGLPHTAERFRAWVRNDYAQRDNGQLAREPRVLR